jgi:phosphoribosylformylglycinamidine cyclo-ligase
MFTGFEIEAGDTLVGLREEGFRSNGLSLVRRILTQNFGEDWHIRSWEEQNVGELVLRPSRIYSRAVISMLGGVDGEPQAKVHGVAHITGGGIPGKLGRILKPKKLGASIDAPFPPGDIVLYCQQLGNVPDEDAYTTWNMGQGMIIVTPEPDNVMDVAKTHHLEAKVIGRVVPTPGTSIRNQGTFKKDKVLKFK